jgi:hypothetical protein
VGEYGTPAPAPAPAHKGIAGLTRNSCIRTWQKVAAAVGQTLQQRSAASITGRAHQKLSVKGKVGSKMWAKVRAGQKELVVAHNETSTDGVLSTEAAGAPSAPVSEPGPELESAAASKTPGWREKAASQMAKSFAQVSGSYYQSSLHGT